jgi:hypothetical protein
MTITDTAQNLQSTVKTLVLIGIAILTFIFIVVTIVRTRAWVPAFGILLVGAAMWWAVNSWETTVRTQVTNQLNEDSSGSSGQNTGG